MYPADALTVILRVFIKRLRYSAICQLGAYYFLLAAPLFCLELTIISTKADILPQMSGTNNTNILQYC